MKRCPSCDKTFEDSMRFCQVDGTALVDDAPAFDPYATIVGSPMVTPPVDEPEPESVPEPVIHETEGSKAIAPPEDVLDLPEADPLKTMYVSDAEMLAALGGDKPAAEPEIIEIPPIEDEPTPADVEMSPVETADEKEEVPAPEPPSFSVPDVPPPSFHDFGPPPSPFSTSEDAPVPPPPAFDTPKPPPPVFNEADTMIQPSFSSPFDDPPAPPPAAAWAPPPAPDPVKSPFDPPPAAPVAEWTPPPAPEPSWQNKDIGANTPFQPPAAGFEGDSKGLAIGSLVTGILSCLCCVSVITGPAAIVMGFIAKKKADEDPKQYGGRGLALGGMITGALGFVIGVSLIILQLFFGVLSSLAR